MNETTLTRREFFIGAAAATTAPVVTKAMMARNCVDENLSVFISDIHVSGVGVKGQHDLTAHDWCKFMDFTDAHGWRNF